MDRRDLLKLAGAALLGGTAGVYAVRLLTAFSGGSTKAGSRSVGKKWGMLVNLDNCRADCTACLDACRFENNVSFHGDNRWDNHWIRKVTVRKEVGSTVSEQAVLLLCNHCDKPPCAQVCPVQATYKRHDGIVIVDHHRCIGCRYCVVACPYNARYFNFKDGHEWPNKDRPRRSHGVAEACTLCAHRLDVGKAPACVEACERAGPAALAVGDLNDPQSEISRLIAASPVKRIREDLGTEPKVFYVGL